MRVTQCTSFNDLRFSDSMIPSPLPRGEGEGEEFCFVFLVTCHTSLVTSWMFSHRSRRSSRFLRFHEHELDRRFPIACPTPRASTTFRPTNFLKTKTGRSDRRLCRQCCRSEDVDLAK